MVMLKKRSVAGGVPVAMPQEGTPLTKQAMLEPDVICQAHDLEKQEDTVRLSFNIRRELHRQLKLKAAGSCRTLSSLMAQWVEEKVSGGSHVRAQKTTDAESP